MGLRRLPAQGEAIAPLGRQHTTVPAKEEGEGLFYRKANKQGSLLPGKSLGFRAVQGAGGHRETEFLLGKEG